jgi:hypothetical protein
VVRPVLVSPLQVSTRRVAAPALSLKGLQPCGLWPTVWATASAASGGLKRWEKLSFRAEHLPPPPDEWGEVRLAEIARIADIAKIGKASL